MHIKSIQFSDDGPRPWEFSRFNFKPINLLVGASGSGKTRFITAIFNIARLAGGANKLISPAKWVIEVEVGEKTLTWQFEGKLEGVENVPRIVSERIFEGSIDSGVSIVDRSEDEFRFNDKVLPKLSQDQSAIDLLRKEETIRPLFDLFAKVIKRSFSEASLGQMISYRTMPKRFRESLKPGKALPSIPIEYGVSVSLLYLKECFKAKYDELIRSYKSVFPFVENCEIMDAAKLGMQVPLLGETPVFAIKERKVNGFIPLHELSSGMQKVLLLMADIMSLQAGHTYLIDEYENSLGVNAIDFLPGFLTENRGDNRFVITTHHPYLINSMPVKNWNIFNRDGSSVTIVDGATLVERYGKSKQQAFVQLINDPRYGLIK